MKKKVYMWLLAMCVTASTATPVYAVEPVAEQSPVEENTGNVEENQEQEKAPENSGENSGEEKNEENSGEVKEPENSGENSGEEKAPENSGENSDKEKDAENSGENADGEENPDEVAEVPEDELALQELGEENQIATFADEEIKTVDSLEDLLDALNNTECKEIQVSGTISVTETLNVNREVKLSGGGTLVRGAKRINLIAVGEKGVLTLENIVLDGNRNTYQWDLSLLKVENGGSLTLLEDTVFQNNHTNSNGGAIQVSNGSLFMEGGTIQNNQTSYPGGGIYVYNGHFVLKDGTICNNISSNQHGGGIYISGSTTFEMQGGLIKENKGYYSGGLALTGSVPVKITGGTITENETTCDVGAGGGILAWCQVEMTGGTITKNTASHGGGVYICKNKEWAAGLEMSDSSITDNYAEDKNGYGDGGGVYVDYSAILTLNNGAIIANNTADCWGGGIRNLGSVIINGGKIANNTSASGGGIHNDKTITMTAGEISGNKSTTGSGGGIYNGLNIVMSGGSITRNIAKSDGGGINQGHLLQVSEKVRISDNQVDGGKASNVFLDYYSYDTENPNCYITIVSPGLSSGSQIGVNINPDKDLNITQAINDADYSKYFTSDDSNYEIINVESNGKYQVSLKKTGSGSGNTGGSESGGSTGGNTGGSESGGSTGGNTGGGESGGTTGGNNGGNTSGSTTGTSTSTSGGGGSASTVTSTSDTTPKETTITVPLQASSQESNQETGNLPANLQQRVLNQKISHTVLSSAETGVKIGLDMEAVRAISGQAQGDASVVVQKLDNTALKGSAAAVIGTRPVVTVQVQDAAGKTITDLGAGSVLVEIPYVLQNGENPGNICAVSTDADGNVQWLLNSVYDSEKQVLRFRTLQGADYGVASIPVGIYQDTVGTDKQADIAFAVSRGLLTGDAKGETFNPEKAVTMEEFANALDRMTGKKVSDVVLGSYEPSQSITREEMAVLLVKYADTLGIVLPKVETANAFADQSQIQTEAVTAVQKLQQAGVLVGKNEQTFAPKETMTRADLCTTLRLLMEMMVRGTCRPE